MNGRRWYTADALMADLVRLEWSWRQVLRSK